MIYFLMLPHQCVFIADQCESVCTLLLCRRGAALLFIDKISLCLRQAEETTDHAQVFPQGSVLGVGIFLPTQQLTQPTLQEAETQRLNRVTSE